MALTCPSCRAENHEAAELCLKCGHPLSAAAAIRQGTVIEGRYEVLSLLGRGGMGAVYKARDRVLDDAVALKVLRSELARAPQMAQRFRSEIRLARKVTHRNVCRIHEYGEDGELCYISMELVEGVDLRQILREQGPLAPSLAFDVAIQAAEGLQAIHDVGIVHRDLKTANMMRDRGGVVKLMDFGIAKQVGVAATGLTTAGYVMGTPDYMSPEQARGDPVDFRSDLYSLGTVVFEMFAGAVPVPGGPLGAAYKQLEDGGLLAVPLAERLPRALEPVLRRALARDPAERPATAREMAEGLRRAQLAGEAKTRPAPWPAVTWPSPLREPRAVTAPTLRVEAPELPEAQTPREDAGPPATVAEAAPATQAAAAPRASTNRMAWLLGILVAALAVETTLLLRGVAPRAAPSDAPRAQGPPSTVTEIVPGPAATPTTTPVPAPTSAPPPPALASPLPATPSVVAPLAPPRRAAAPRALATPTPTPSPATLALQFATPRPSAPADPRPEPTPVAAPVETPPTPSPVSAPPARPTPGPTPVATPAAPEAASRVPSLIEALRGSSGETRRGAIRELVTIGGPAVPALVEALSDRRGYVRAGALAALRQIGPAAASARPAIEAALKDGDRLVRDGAASALDAIREASSRPAAPLPSPPSAAAPSAPEPPSVTALIAGLKARDRQARLLAVDRLGALGPAAKTAIPALIALIRESAPSDPELVAKAQDALRRISGR